MFCLWDIACKMTPCHSLKTSRVMILLMGFSSFRIIYCHLRAKMLQIEERSSAKEVWRAFETTSTKKKLTISKSRVAIFKRPHILGN